MYALALPSKVVAASVLPLSTDGSDGSGQEGFIVKGSMVTSMEWR